MIGLLIFYLILIFVFYVCLSLKTKALKQCEEQLQRTENLNEVLEERVRTLQAVKTHHEYLLQERDNDNAELLERVIELEVKLKNKKKKVK